VSPKARANSGLSVEPLSPIGRGCTSAPQTTKNPAQGGVFDKIKLWKISLKMIPKLDNFLKGASLEVVAREFV
jgi:hypothetical protein